jgi:plastocyanin
VNLRRRRVLPMLLLPGLAWAGAARGSGATPAAAAAGVVVEVDMRDYQYRPPTLQIKVGTTVRWTNGERRTTHSIRFLGPEGLESERLFPGESWQRRFDKPGTFAYVCGPHPEMKGEIEVLP